jgi:hypothetical protein
MIGNNRGRQACRYDQLRFILLARTPADEPYLLGKLGNRAPPPAASNPSHPPCCRGGGRARRQWRDGRVRR